MANTTNPALQIQKMKIEAGGASVVRTSGTPPETNPNSSATGTEGVIDNFSGHFTTPGISDPSLGTPRAIIQNAVAGTTLESIRQRAAEAIGEIQQK